MLAKCAVVLAGEIQSPLLARSAMTAQGLLGSGAVAIHGAPAAGARCADDFCIPLGAGRTRRPSHPLSTATAVDGLHYCRRLRTGQATGTLALDEAKLR